MSDDPPHPGDWRRPDGDLARAAAAMLIANSHLERLYPRPWLAGDGLLGNALFYFLSGFGVSLAASTRHAPFGRWMLRRMARLYPAVWIAGLIQVPVTTPSFRWTLGQLAQTFVFPTQYGYVGDVVLIYAGLYWLLRARAALWIVTGALAVATVVTYALQVPHLAADAHLALGQTGPFLHRYYFVAVALGGALFGPAARRPRGTLGWDLALLAGLFAAYVGLKYEMVGGHGTRAFLVLHALAAAMCVLAVRVSAADPVRAILRRVRPVGWAVAGLAAITLEMYVVQFWSHDWPWVVRYRFPINLAVFWTLTVAGAIALRAVTGWVMSLTRFAGGVARRSVRADAAGKPAG